MDSVHKFYSGTQICIDLHVFVPVISSPLSPSIVSLIEKSGIFLLAVVLVSIESAFCHCRLL